MKVELVCDVSQQVLEGEANEVVGKSLHKCHRLYERSSQERLDVVVDHLVRALGQERSGQERPIWAEQDDGAVKDLGKKSSCWPHCHHCIHLRLPPDQVQHLSRPDGLEGKLLRIPSDSLIQKAPQTMVKQAWI